MKAKIGLLGVVMSFLFIGCNDDDQTDADVTADDLTISANMDEMSDNISKIAFDQYIQQSEATGKNADAGEPYLPACATLTVAVTGNNWVRTIDFGTTNCTLRDGSIVKGKLILTGSTDFNQPSYTINCSFSNFYLNGSLIQGTKKVVRTIGSTPNLQSVHPILTMDDNLKETPANKIVRTLTGTRVMEMVEGINTPASNWPNYVFLITGKETITSLTGIIKSTITVPLVVKLNCNHVVKGVVVFTKNLRSGTLDYGDGTCDNKASGTINGIVETVLLGDL